MENNYKLICFDLDGTLLNSKKEISRETLQILRRIEDRGVHLSIVTGRAGYDARTHARFISDRVFYIGANGTAVGSLAEDRILFEMAMQKENVRKLIDLAEVIGISPVFFTAEHSIISRFDDYRWHLLFNLKNGLEYLKHYRFVPQKRKFNTLVMQPDVPVTKATFTLADKQVAKLFRSRLEQLGCFELSVYADIFYEVTEKGVNKSHGIKALMEYLKIRRQEVMAFGDGDNDRDMLKFAGYGVAMGNALDSIKAVADTITDTNDRDGVASILKQVYSL